MSRLLFKMFIFFYIFLAAISATSFFASAQIGQSNFDGYFDTSTTYKGSVGALFHNGIMLEGAILIDDAPATSSDADSLAMTAGLASLNYHFFREDALSPFIGGLLGFASLNNSYDKNPSIIYGAKAGLNFMINNTLQPFLEVSYLSIDTSLDGTVNATSVNAGMRFCFFSDSTTDKPQVRRPKKKRKKAIRRRPFRKPPPEPRHPY